MQVTNNSPIFTGKNLKITHELNNGRTYLFNEVLNILRESPVPATFGNNGISINAPKGSNNIEKVISDLTKAGINFDTIV